MWEFVNRSKRCFVPSSSYTILSLVPILFFTMKMVVAQRLVSYPCVDMDAIKWVRDAHLCDQYYICHFGQPLAMPACPKGQVWGTKALNCVPEGSRWDDCSSQTSVSTNRQNVQNPTFTKPRRNDAKTSPTLRPALLQGLHNNHPHRHVTRFVTPRPKRQMPWYLIDPKHDDNKNKNNKIQVVGLPNNVEIKQPKRIQKLATTKLPLYFAGFPKGWKTDPVKSSTLTWGHKYGEGIQNVLEWYTTRAPPSNSTVVNYNRKARTKAPPRRRKQKDRTRKKLRPKEIETIEAPRSQFQHLVERDHPCLQQPGAFLRHPDMCHWYFNCSLNNLDDSKTDDLQEDLPSTLNDNKEGFIRIEPYRVKKAGIFVWECRYPQLFDDTTNRCREFMNVKCGKRYEPVDQCEYSSRECHSSRCVPCDQRFGRCRGKENGIYPLQSRRWTPVFVTCYQQRNIAQDECQAPAPIFSPEDMDCVSLYDVPKKSGGLLPDCTTRPDGYYPDEQGRCAMFFRCSIGQFRGYDECPLGSVFDPAVPACQPFALASQPCGEGQAPLCGGKLDGLYADQYGRCTHFFKCKGGLFQKYYSCDTGIFDPLTQQCVIEAERVLRPCGLKPNPCETLPTGVYPDQVTGCKHFIECHHGIMVTNGTCDRGRVFSAISGRCDLPENTPPPCGFAPTCSERPDGRYPALNRGCSFFYECYHGQFISLRRCTAADGGFFFNPGTSKCDYPQNICPPCGYRWWGCSSSDYLT